MTKIEGITEKLDPWISLKIMKDISEVELESEIHSILKLYIENMNTWVIHNLFERNFNLNATTLRHSL